MTDSNFLNQLNSSDRVIRDTAASSLVSSLRSADPSEALDVLQTVTKRNANVQTVVAAGGVAALVQLLQTDRYRLSALDALARLARGRLETQAAEIEAGAVQPIVEILAKGDRAAQSLALFALRQLIAGCSDHQDAAASAGAIGVIVNLLASPCRVLVREAALTLALLVEGNPRTQMQAVVASGIQGVMSALLNNHDGDANTVKALRCLLDENPQGKVTATIAGAARLLAGLLESSNGAVKTEACHALAVLFASNEQAKMAAIDAGVVPRLTRMLSDEPISATATEIANLMLDRPRDEASVTAVDASSIKPFVDFISSSVDSESTEASLALARLVDNNALAAKEAVSVGILPRLFARIRTGSGEALVNDTILLRNILISDCSYHRAARDAGMLKPLVTIMDRGPEKARLYAFEIIECITASNPAAKLSAVEAGVMEPIARMLESSSSRLAVILSLGTFVLDNTPIQNAAVDAGVIPVLLDLLVAGTDREPPAAAFALAMIAYNNPHSRRVAVDAGAISLLLRLVEAAIDRNASYAVIALDQFVDGYRDLLVEANAVESIIGLLRSIPGLAEPLATLANLVMRHRTAQERALVAGAVPLLVSLLSPGGPEDLATNAALALGRLSDGNALVQDAVLEVEGEKRLVEVARRGGTSPRLHALIALVTLVDGNRQAQARVLDTDVVEVTVALLQSDIDELRLTSAYTLGSLVGGFPEAQTAAVDVGAVPLLVEHMRVARDDALVKATFALSKIVLDLPVGLTALIQAGGIEIVKQLLVSTGTTNKANVCILLKELVRNNAEAQTAVLESGVLLSLVELLISEDDIQRENAASALARAVENYPEAKREALSLGALDRLARMMHSDSQEEIHASIQALWELVVGAREAQDAFLRPVVVARLVHLGLHDSELVRQSALVLLRDCVRGNDFARVATTSAGAIPVLMSLLQTREDQEAESAATLLALLLAAEPSVNTYTHDPISVLADLLDPENQTSTANAVLVLRELLNAGDGIQERLISVQAVDRFVECIRDASLHVSAVVLKGFTDVLRGRPLLKSAAVAAGIIEQLVAVSRAGRDKDRMMAIAACQILLEDSQELRAAMAASGIVHPLVEIVRASTEDLQVVAILLLVSLVGEGDRTLKNELTSSGMVETLASLILASSAEMQLAASMLLGLVALRNSIAQALAIQAGVLRCLVDLIGNGAEIVRPWAAMALGCLVENQRVTGEDALTDEAIRGLFQLVREGDSNGARFAICALGCLAKESPQNQAKLIAAGVVSILMVRLSDEEIDVRAAAACALGLLARNNASTAAAVADANAMEKLCDMVATETISEMVGAGTGLLYLLKNCSEERDAARETFVVRRLLDNLKQLGDAEQEMVVEAIEDFAADDRVRRELVSSLGGLEALEAVAKCSSDDTRAKAKAALAMLHSQGA